MAATLIGRVQKPSNVILLTPSSRMGRMTNFSRKNAPEDGALAVHLAQPCIADADKLDSLAYPQATSAHLHRKGSDESTDTGSDSNSDSFGIDDSPTSSAEVVVAVRTQASGPRTRSVRFLDEVTGGSVEEVLEIPSHEIEMVEAPISMCTEYGDLLDSFLDSDEEATSGVDMVSALARLL